MFHYFYFSSVVSALTYRVIRLVKHVIQTHFSFSHYHWRAFLKMQRYKCEESTTLLCLLSISQIYFMCVYDRVRVHAPTLLIDGGQKTAVDVNSLELESHRQL